MQQLRLRADLHKHCRGNMSSPNILVKQQPRRSDPKDPSTYPDWERAKAYSKKIEPTLTFESEADKRDYYRKVASNPSNLPGLVCYPPLELKSVFSFDDVYTREMLERGYWARCSTCNGLYNPNHYGHECSTTEKEQ